MHLNCSVKVEWPSVLSLMAGLAKSSSGGFHRYLVPRACLVGRRVPDAISAALQHTAPTAVACPPASAADSQCQHRFFLRVLKGPQPCSNSTSKTSWPHFRTLSLPFLPPHRPRGCIFSPRALDWTETCSSLKTLRLLICLLRLRSALPLVPSHLNFKLDLRQATAVLPSRSSQ